MLMGSNRTFAWSSCMQAARSCASSPARRCASFCCCTRWRKERTPARCCSADDKAAAAAAVRAVSVRSRASASRRAASPSPRRSEALVQKKKEGMTDCKRRWCGSSGAAVELRLLAWSRFLVCCTYFGTAHYTAGFSRSVFSITVAPIQASRPTNHLAAIAACSVKSFLPRTS